VQLRKQDSNTALLFSLQLTGLRQLKQNAGNEIEEKNFDLVSPAILSCFEQLFRVVVHGFGQVINCKTSAGKCFATKQTTH
jgi:hypothetical protein